MNFWKVAVDAPLSELLTYSDESLSVEDQALIRRGLVVFVPLKSRQTQGIVVGSGVPGEGYKIKSISQINKELNYRELPIIDEASLKWLEWISQYYIYPLGEIVATSFPPLKKSLKERKSKKKPVIASVEPSQPPTLTEEQEQVIKDIKTKSGFSTHYIFGVTGSGKTEIYLNLLADTLEKGKAGILIVPEISLTPQLTERVSARFGNQVAVLHSQLTEREKTNQWWDVVTGARRILVGARSALFCPVPELGLIVVDEEHEASFKQDEKLKYHARDAAIMLAHFKNCPILLGSATPSLECWLNIKNKKFNFHKLSKRVEDRRLPELAIVDLKKEREFRKDPKNLTPLIRSLPDWLSFSLYEKIQETLDKKEQVALFLNRRGFANSVLCPLCAFVKECPNCDISLTLHGKKHLVCHYCDYQEFFKEECPSCKEGLLKPLGMGTEQIELEIERLFPFARIARADRDEITSREDMERLIHAMENHEIDILIGTQMIAKGLDFPKLTAVGIIMADIGIHMPDFRASERGFQLITQVSGRAGRHLNKDEGAGQVIIQTMNPQHSCIQMALKADYEAFADFELQSRMELGYPPYGRLLLLRIQGRDLDKVRTTCRGALIRCEYLKEKVESYSDIVVLGPAEAPLSRIKNLYRFHLIFKGVSPSKLNSFCRQVLGTEDWVDTGVRLIPDVDPQNLLS
jgi:primosomal protein N' (replication factor Y)